ncbi:hypothetical protein B0H15DRAFT_381524 [Mycena belliarum]|uniref:Uncharacterized protein n=1 Tax=Mycena belliarum TaxID=1033014 RepID=A0AAD6TZA8_9AGAR|nr:hypothetical protein B0H15DRAFT_381524 [Mycena belliae]
MRLVHAVRRPHCLRPSRRDSVRAVPARVAPDAPHTSLRERVCDDTLPVETIQICAAAVRSRRDRRTPRPPTTIVHRPHPPWSTAAPKARRSHAAKSDLSYRRIACPRASPPLGAAPSSCSIPLPCVNARHEQSPSPTFPRSSLRPPALPSLARAEIREPQPFALSPDLHSHARLQSARSRPPRARARSAPSVGPERTSRSPPDLPSRFRSRDSRACSRRSAAYIAPRELARLRQAAACRDLRRPTRPPTTIVCHDRPPPDRRSSTEAPNALPAHLPAPAHRFLSTRP